MTLRVTVPDGLTLQCSWVVNVAGPGLRVEMCYPESETRDLDLFLHRPNDSSDWYPAGADPNHPNPFAACGWDNCEATIRGTLDGGVGSSVPVPVARADWGYADTPLSRCVNGQNGDQWRPRGSCANPRLDIDNNLSPGAIGLPENINVDDPRDGETFRIMVQNFSGTVAHPVVNVYCGGQRVATYGQAPDRVYRFSRRDGFMTVGAMWRVADVTTHVDPATGETTSCDVTALHPAGRDSGYLLTWDDPSF